MSCGQQEENKGTEEWSKKDVDSQDMLKYCGLHLFSFVPLPVVTPYCKINMCLSK